MNEGRHSDGSRGAQGRKARCGEEVEAAQQKRALMEGPFQVQGERGGLDPIQEVGRVNAAVVEELIDIGQGHQGSHGHVEDNVGLGQGQLDDLEKFVGLILPFLGQGHELRIAHLL